MLPPHVLAQYVSALFTSMFTLVYIFCIGTSHPPQKKKTFPQQILVFTLYFVLCYIIVSMIICEWMSFTPTVVSLRINKVSMYTLFLQHSCNSLLTNPNNVSHHSTSQCYWKDCLPLQTQLQRQRAREREGRRPQACKPYIRHTVHLHNVLTFKRSAIRIMITG